MPHTNTRTHKNMTACKTMNLSRQDKPAKPTYDSRKEAFAEKEKRLSKHGRCGRRTGQQGNQPRQRDQEVKMIDRQQATRASIATNGHNRRLHFVCTLSGIGCKERLLREQNARPRDSRLEDSVYAVPIHESAFGEITVNDDLRDLTERSMTISSLPSMPLKSVEIRI